MLLTIGFGEFLSDLGSELLHFCTREDRGLRVVVVCLPWLDGAARERRLRGLASVDDVLDVFREGLEAGSAKRGNLSGESSSRRIPGRTYFSSSASPGVLATTGLMGMVTASIGEDVSVSPSNLGSEAAAHLDPIRSRASRPE